MKLHRLLSVSLLCIALSTTSAWACDRSDKGVLGHHTHTDSDKHDDGDHHDADHDKDHHDSTGGGCNHGGSGGGSGSGGTGKTTNPPPNPKS